MNVQPEIVLAAIAGGLGLVSSGLAAVLRFKMQWDEHSEQKHRREIELIEMRVSESRVNLALRAINDLHLSDQERERLSEMVASEPPDGESADKKSN
jgi:hypothetical protein